MKLYSIISNLVSKIKNVLLTKPLDTVCDTNVIYLVMNGNSLGKYEDFRILADSVVNSTLMKIIDIEWRIKVLKILVKVSDILIKKLFLYILW